MRGTTPYDRRGIPLILPKGTINNPALRLGGERSGLYLGGNGVLNIGLKTLKAFELTSGGASVHSQTSGAGHVTPLTLVRANATTADNEETQTDYYETTARIARTATYRQSSAPYKYGFKWYGFSSGLHATPAMTLTGDKDLIVGRDLHVTRNVVMTAGNMGLAPTAHNTGLYLGADAFTPSVRLGNDDVEATSTNRLEMGLNVGAATLGGNISDAVVRTAGSSPGRLVLGTGSIPRLVMDQTGNASYQLPASGGFYFLRASDSVAISYVTNTGMFGLAPNSVGTTQIQDGSITAAKMVGGTLAYVPTAGGTMSGKLTIDKPGATSATNFPTAGLEVIARDSGLAGIAFHRPGIFGAMLHESNGQLRWDTQLVWTDSHVSTGTIITKLGFAPVNKAGDTMTGQLTMSAGANISVPSGSQVIGDGEIRLARAVGPVYYGSTNQADALVLQMHNAGGSPGYSIGCLNAAGSGWDLLLHHTAAGFGVQVQAPTFHATASGPAVPLTCATTTICTNLNAQYLQGFVPANFAPAAHLAPSGLHGFFWNAAWVAPGWTREPLADGRLIGAAGSAGGRSWAENGQYGSSWDHSHGSGDHAHYYTPATHRHGIVTGAIAQSGSSLFTLNASETNDTGGTRTQTENGSSTTTAYSWAIPMYTSVMAYKT